MKIFFAYVSDDSKKNIKIPDIKKIIEKMLSIYFFSYS